MQEAQQALPIAGVFTPRLVARLHLEGFDGSLRFSTATATRVVYFRRGEIASAASNADADRLPNILIRDGRLTEPQLEMARSRLQPGVSLGKMLIELGFLTPSELLQGARRQVRQILAACFALTEGAYQINPGPLPKEVTVLGLPSRRLIFDALLEAGDRQTIVREMGSMESVYRPSPTFQSGLASIKLDASTEQVGKAVDGIRTLRDISSQTSLDDFTVSRVVLALEILGLVEADRAVSLAAAASSARLIPVEAPAAELAPPEPPAHPEPPEPRSSAPVPVGAAAVVASPAAWAVPEDDAEQPPPIPPGELPAFAVPPGYAPEWRLDPETGEKSLPGPVEMTFDGQVGPAPARSSPARRWGAAAAFVAVVLAAAVVAGFMRGRHSKPPEAAEHASNPAQEAAPDSPAPITAPPVTRPEPEPVPPPQVAGPEGRPDEARPQDARPEEEGPEEPRFAEARRLLDEGRVAEAADLFRGLLREGGAERFTLQLMIACEPATLQKAVSATRSEGDLIVVPFALQGRACYRACWGTYGSRQEAQNAASSLPAYFTGASLRPVVISFARLAPPG